MIKKRTDEMGILSQYCEKEALASVTGVAFFSSKVSQ